MKLSYIFLFLLLTFLLLPSHAWAACSGTSPNLTAATWADIAACHAVASSGATITVTAGSYTATTQIKITKYVKILMGGTVNVLDNTCPGYCETALINLTESAAGSTKLQGPLNITKGTATHTDTGGVIILDSASGGKPLLVTDVHYTLSGSGNFFNAHVNRGVLWNNSATGSVADNPNCYNNASFLRHKLSGLGLNGWQQPLAYGAADTNGDQNLYVENNTLNAVLEGLDNDDDARTVFRYNTVINSGMISHGVDTSGPLGGRFVDYDHNIFVRDLTPQGGACGGLPVNMNGFIYLRGGTALIHDNVIPDIKDGAWGDKSEITFVVEELRRRSGGYPCWTGGYPAPHQTGWGWITGGTKSGMGTQDIDPIYLWNNTGAGNYGTPSIGDYPNECGANPPTSLDYIHQNREYFPSTAKPGYTPYRYPHPLTTGTDSNRPAVSISIN